jgi:LysM repeat protein
VRAVADAVSSSPFLPIALCALFAAAPQAASAANRGVTARGRDTTTEGRGATAAKSAAQSHVVSAGENLEAIAKRYGVSVDDLREANTVDAKDKIRPGQQLTIPTPERRGESSRQQEPTSVLVADGTDRHRVAPGDTLSQLALKYKTSVEKLTAINGLGKEQSIRIGQVLIVPGSSKSRGGSWQRYARPVKQKGYLHVVTPGSRFVGLAVDADGRLRKHAVRALNDLLGAGGRHPPLPERLIRILVKVSDTFGGRSIRVVSGYRTASYYEDSRHKLSSAVDFSVIGVPNAVVCEYLRGIEAVGVGYYPNSSFVHLDVRSHSAYWVDYSGPGEPPRLSPNAPATPPPRREHRRLFAELDALLARTTASLERAGADSPRTATAPGRRSRRPEDRERLERE